LRLIKLSDDFIKELSGFSAGYFFEKDFEKLLNLFESEIQNHFFTHSSESNLLRIINGMFDKFFFLNECLNYPHYVEILVAIASNSNYLSDILVINPEFFYRMTDSSIMNSKLDKKTFSEEVEKRISSYDSLDAKTHAINSLKRREILRIGLKDILNNTEIAETTAELSILANTLAKNLFESCYHFILNKYKIEKINRSYCIIALGKLGGNELNYSSDIDIIIFYDKESKIGNRYYSEILSETIQLFINKCSLSESGSLYRIDLRLRPDGKSSSVCRSLREYLDYYESRGNDWERQMLIKAAFLGGSEKLYSHFTKYIDRFIYPSIHFISPLEQMKKLKQIIEREVEDKENIKLIPGGIRDIEFIEQALQLLNGGKNESLKTGHTLTALRKLKMVNLLTTNEEEILREAYIFYRKIEHFLQLMNNAQTHTIPESGEIAEKLSFYLDSKDLDKFKEKIKESRENVRDIYNSIIGEEETTSPANALFQQIKFDNPQRALNDFSFLREGKGLTVSRKFDKKSLEAFSKIEENISEYLIAAYDPDLCLSNFVRIIKQAHFPSIWYDEFNDKNLITIFLTLCEQSQMVIDLFAEDRNLRESFLSRDFLSDAIKIDFKKSRLKELLFMLGVQLSLGLIEFESASSILSSAVIEKIRSSIEINAAEKKWKNDYFIIVLGSTGMKTMSLASDIDLIFAVKDSTKYPNIQKDFQELLGILKKEIAPLPVDCRLRPEGENSQLVWDFDKYIEYLNKRARIWELQSFLKARFICGNKKLFNNLVDSFIQRITFLTKEEVTKGISKVRSKSLSSFPVELNLVDLKKNPGGLSDVEYIAHYLLLSKVSQPLNLIGKSIPEILVNLKGSKKVLNELADNYIFLKKLEVFNQLAFNSSSSKITDDEKRYGKLARIMKIKDAHSLKTKLNSVLNINRKYFSGFILKK
jgi:glutamate-ammonia-ligase adenylyltransferase